MPRAVSAPRNWQSLCVFKQSLPGMFYGSRDPMTCGVILLPGFETKYRWELWDPSWKPMCLRTLAGRNQGWGGWRRLLCCVVLSLTALTCLKVMYSSPNGSKLTQAYAGGRDMLFIHLPIRFGFRQSCMNPHRNKGLITSHFIRKWVPSYYERIYLFSTKLFPDIHTPSQRRCHG